MPSFLDTILQRIAFRQQFEVTRATGYSLERQTDRDFGYVKILKLVLLREKKNENSIQVLAKFLTRRLHIKMYTPTHGDNNL